MKYHFTSVPALDGAQAAAALNRFLGAHRVAQVERTLVVDGANSYWAICVTYLDASAAAPTKGSSRKRIDFKEILPQEQFRVFARLREARKALAERDGVPAYSVFTNGQLVAMVQTPTTTLAQMQAISGVGPARLEKYGKAMLEIIIAAPELGAS